MQRRAVSPVVWCGVVLWNMVGMSLVGAQGPCSPFSPLTVLG